MRKKLIVMCVWFLMATVPVPVIAQSLDDVVNSTTDGEVTNDAVQKNAQESVQDNSSNVYSTSVLDDINSKSDMSKQTEMTKNASGPIFAASSLLTQLIFYLITLGLPVAVLADLGFLVIPFLRTGGVNSQSNMLGQNGGMAGGMMGGMNRGYGMAGGMNRGYGMNGGMMGGMNSGMAGGMNAGQQPITQDKFLIIKVSENVIAIASSQVSTTEKMKEYVKDSIVKVVASGIMAVLFVTGALTKLSIFLGEAVGNAIVSNI